MMNSSASNRYTLLPEESGAAFRVIQDLASRVEPATELPRGSKPHNPEPFSDDLTTPPPRE